MPKRQFLLIKESQIGSQAKNGIFRISRTVEILQAIV